MRIFIPGLNKLVEFKIVKPSDVFTSAFQEINSTAKIELVFNKVIKNYETLFDDVTDPETIELVKATLLSHIDSVYDLKKNGWSVTNDLYVSLDDLELTYDNIKKVRSVLKKGLIGQDHVIESVVDSLIVSSAGLKEDNKPVCSLFFAGSTGVGKTETARLLSKALSDDPKKFIKIDCSEYASEHEYAKLIGAPPGYLGHNNKASVLDKIKEQKPFVILFDEIEKGHPKLHDLLLQLLEDATLTSGTGETISLSNCIIIMTSNTGVKEVSKLDKLIGFNNLNKSDDIKQKEFKKALKGSFKEEFLNRLDNIIVFNQLTLSDLRKIAKLRLEELAERVYKKHNIKLTYTRSLLTHILKYNNDDLAWGARPIKRAIKQLITIPLSRLIIKKNLKDVIIKIEKKKNDLEFKVLDDFSIKRKEGSL